MKWGKGKCEIIQIQDERICVGEMGRSREKGM
jgi:hypothetical protein